MTGTTDMRPAAVRWMETAPQRLQLHALVIGFVLTHGMLAGVCFARGHWGFGALALSIATACAFLLQWAARLSNGWITLLIRMNDGLGNALEAVKGTLERAMETLDQEGEGWRGPIQ